MKKTYDPAQATNVANIQAKVELRNEIELIKDAQSRCATQCAHDLLGRCVVNLRMIEDQIHDQIAVY
jgi:hypothetical protein